MMRLGRWNAIKLTAASATAEFVELERCAVRFALNSFVWSRICLRRMHCHLLVISRFCSNDEKISNG